MIERDPSVDGVQAAHGEGAAPPGLHLVQTCVNLRHKLMYVDIEHMQPGLVDDSSTTRQYWCQRTQDARGPDGAPVSPQACSASRECHCGRGGDRR